MRKIFILVLVFTTFLVDAKSFVTEGNGLRNLVTANIKGKTILYTSELDGVVSAYTTEGNKLWSAKTDKKAVLFELKASDINGDGNDDLLVASGDGSIYCWSSQGALLWKYTPKQEVSFTEVAVVKNEGNTQIFAGGNNGVLYELNTSGKEVSNTTIGGAVRLIAAGNFSSPSKQDLFVMTYSHDKYRWDFFGFINPNTKKIYKQLSVKKAKALKSLSKMMITDFEVADITKDGLDNLLFYGTVNAGVFTALDGNFNKVASFVATNKEKQRYAHAQGACLLPLRNEIAFQYGGFMHRLSLKGKDLQSIGARYSGIIYNKLVSDAATKQLFAAGQVGGGNTIYSYPINKSSWLTTDQHKQGRMLTVKNNIETLYKQTLKFTPPAYQKTNDKEWTMITPFQPAHAVFDKDAAKLKIVKQEIWQENTPRDAMVAKIGKVALKKDRRGKYNLSRADIIAKAKAYEKEGQPFTIWAGHGTDPFYLQIETLEDILKVAPSTCYGFIYAEMSNVEDPRVQLFIKEYIPRLAKAIRKNNKAKLYFRYKNMFWGATAYLSPWKELFLSGKYSDFLVPAAEDTSSRTQDINFTGRVGMLLGGYVNDYAMRLVDDNPTSWRPYTPGGQRSVSPYLRNGIMLAAYGGHYGVIFNNKYLEKPGFNALFALMTSGVIPMVDKKDIVSVGSWMLVKDANEKLIASVDNHHDVKQYSSDDSNAVIAKAQMHWAGGTVPAYDYSKALGVDYRWLNYLPEMPNGIIPIGPEEMSKQFNKEGKPYFVSDIKQGFVKGEAIPAKDFGKVISQQIDKGATQMPLVVKGASWCALRLDKNHIRVILVDPGYINPQDCKVTISFNNKKPLKAVDILSKEKLSINDNINTVVPAGSAKFIDLTY